MFRIIFVKCENNNVSYAWSTVKSRLSSDKMYHMHYALYILHTYVVYHCAAIVTRLDVAYMPHRRTYTYLSCGKWN